jgi:Holliday junction DNA helicase RuvA
MIGRLTGTVVAQEADGVLVVDVGGVGYEVFAPLGTLGRAGGDAGRVTLFVHTHVREDALLLYGFASEFERFAFRTLLGVSSVGPKTALAVLSALPASDLARAVAEKDVGRLTKVPGIGKKSAERLVLELRDKLPVTGEPRAEVATPRPGRSRTEELVVSALTNMGYRAAEAERAVASLGNELDARPVAELVREALAVLAK